MLKVAFLLLAGANGRGGHLHSARDLGLSFQESGMSVDYYGLCSAGVDIQPLKHLSNYHRIEITQKLCGILSAIREYVGHQTYDAIIILDEMAVRLMHVACLGHTDRMIAIKPGWVNSKAWSPHVKALVCFSRENFEYFRASAKYANTNLHLLPQRVRPALINGALLNDLRSEYNLDRYDIIIMAAGRLDFGEGNSPGKKEIFDYGLRLYSNYKKLGLIPFLFFAGKAKDPKTRSKAMEMIQDLEGTALLDNDKYTNKLSSIFGATDVLIGYGRTAMEAMSLGVPVIVPVSTGESGILISKSSFPALQYYNFTNRVEAAEIDLVAEKNKIESLCNPKVRAKIAAEVRELFTEELSATSAVPGYKELIEAQDDRGFTVKSYAFVFSLFRLLLFFKIKKYISMFRLTTSR